VLKRVRISGSVSGGDDDEDEEDVDECEVFVPLRVNKRSEDNCDVIGGTTRTANSERVCSSASNTRLEQEEVQGTEQEEVEEVVMRVVVVVAAAATDDDADEMFERVEHRDCCTFVLRIHE
jgi:hypothetical protein